MSKPKDVIKRAVSLLLLLVLILPEISLCSSEYIEVLLGDDPKGDANPASVDILKVWITNNGTHFGFIIKCRATPSPSDVRSYNVWMDTKGDSGTDYLLRAGGVSGLYEVTVQDGSLTLVYKAPIEVKIKGKKIYLIADLDDIDYYEPGGVKDPVGVIVTTYQPLFKKRDRAPDTGRYEVAHEVIPELPGYTPFIFVPSVIVTICFIYRRKFKQAKE
jgi:hypothetical protein